MFQSVREEEETAATEKVEIELEEERNRLTVEIENEQRVTLGTNWTLIEALFWIKYGDNCMSLEILTDFFIWK